MPYRILKLLNQRHLEQLKERWWNENKRKAECPKDDNQSDGISIHNIGINIKLLEAVFFYSSLVDV